MTSAQQQFIVWLHNRNPGIYHKAVARTKVPSIEPVKYGGGTHGLGAASNGTSIIANPTATPQTNSWFDSFTSALTTGATLATTLATDKALISLNLQRAQQGLAPLQSLPAGQVMTPTQGQLISSSIFTPTTFIGLGAVGLLVLVLIRERGKRKKK